ncbi:hypothetical protein DPM13_00670 [Paracoccus mutanolyticus]|uniref:Uncharacterized protein n=1 Tax=Paracoccus mutanolyticus TaxID=1499308 RepID=A0ABM6WNX2_9RHOB|nr:hypothetical protein DPM13_00670 [Paracoccus mutanolyticus]
MLSGWKPYSDRGAVRLRDADWRMNPAVDFNLLSAAATGPGKASHGFAGAVQAGSAAGPWST